ncbi:zf-PARP-domain-containing protein, partial [Sistotremastrum suecicum HHB10207 ss-3]
KYEGPKPCSGTVLEKGTLRLGSLVDIRGNQSFQWRHWGCTTAKLIENMKKELTEAEDLDGFDDITPENQEKIRKAWEEGHVADEDIPDSARKPPKDAEGGDDEKPKKRAAAKKQPIKEVDSGADDDEDEKPKKKARTTKKAKVQAQINNRANTDFGISGC